MQPRPSTASTSYPGIDGGLVFGGDPAVAPAPVPGSVVWNRAASSALTQHSSCQRRRTSGSSSGHEPQTSSGLRSESRISSSNCCTRGFSAMARPPQGGAFGGPAPEAVDKPTDPPGVALVLPAEPLSEELHFRRPLNE